MAKPIVLIRADGSTEIGLGHLIRCLALAQMLKDNFKIIFICKEIPEKIKKELADNQFFIEQIEEETTFFNKINSENIVVLDGYNFDTDYQKKIKEKGCKLICIDDLHDKEFFADLIINHAPGIKPEDYHAQPYTQFALGPEYALLRHTFLEQAKKHRVPEKTEIILICFGGADSKNFTAVTLTHVLTYREFKKIIVVTGPSYKYLDTLNLLVETDKRVVHYHAVNEKEMLALMLEAQLAIVPASGTLYEVLATGCKVISGYYIDNQAGIYNGFLSLQAITDAKDFSPGYITDSLNKIKNNSTISVLDGKSSDRLLSKITEMYADRTA